MILLGQFACSSGDSNSNIVNLIQATSAPTPALSTYIHRNVVASDDDGDIVASDDIKEQHQYQQQQPSATNRHLTLDGTIHTIQHQYQHHSTQSTRLLRPLPRWIERIVFTTRMPSCAYHRRVDTVTLSAAARRSGPRQSCAVRCDRRASAIQPPSTSSSILTTLIRAHTADDTPSVPHCLPRIRGIIGDIPRGGL